MVQMNGPRCAVKNRFSKKQPHFDQNQNLCHKTDVETNAKEGMSGHPNLSIIRHLGGSTLVGAQGITSSGASSGSREWGLSRAFCSISMKTAHCHHRYSAETASE